jgi:hypothetical protein
VSQLFYGHKLHREWLVAVFLHTTGVKSILHWYYILSSAVVVPSGEVLHHGPPGSAPEWLRVIIPDQTWLSQPRTVLLAIRTLTPQYVQLKHTFAK